MPQPAATTIPEAPGGAIPEPPLPLALQTLGYGLWPARYLHWCRRRYGDRFVLRLPSVGASVVLADPAAIRDAYALKPPQTRSDPEVIAPFVGGRSVLCQDGDAHDRQRRMLASALRLGTTGGFEDAAAAITRLDMASWPIGRAFPLHPRLQTITLEVILRVVFGMGEGAALDALRARLAPFLHQAGSLLVLNPGFRRPLGGRSPWARFCRLRDELLDALAGEVARRRTAADPADRPDVLSVLVRHADDGGLDDDELLDNLLTIVLAGHDTTATALAWTLDLLLHRPAALDRLRSELLAADTSYLDAVIKESLRLRPVIADTGRHLTEAAVVGGHRYEAGTKLSPSILLAHQDERTYRDPFSFRPERFLDGAAEPLTWVAFGGGTRRCLGAGIALVEMRVILRTIVTGCDLRPARRRPDRQARRAVTLYPRHGARAIATRIDA